MQNSIIPIECNVPDAGTNDHLITWSEIRDRVYSVNRLENGISARLPSTLSDAMKKYAENEALCCPSIVIEIEQTESELDITITSDNADTARGISSMFSSGKQQ